MQTASSSAGNRFSVSTLLPGISAGAVNGVLIVIFQSAYAALIFSGPLADHLPQGLGMMLFGAFVMGLVVALTSSFYGTVTAPQDAPTAIMALIAASMAAAMVATFSQEQVFYTIVAAIALTSLVTGIFLALLGRFRLGNMIRFIPYPVVGGFLAGTGWILVKGAIGIMAGKPLGLQQAGWIFEAAVLLRWLPGVVFALLLFGLMRRFRHFLMMPVVILSAIALFYLLLLLSGTTIATASELGYLLPPLSSGIRWEPLLPHTITQVQWPFIVAQSGELATIVIISVISLLLNASGLELIARQEVDLNRELLSTGLANMLSGLGSSSVGYMSLSLSAFGYRLGSRSRIAGLVSSGICGLTLLAGAGVSSYFPKPLLGGLLFYLGLTFLLDWLYSAWFKLPRTEYALVVLITLTIAFAGFLQGMMLGVLIAVVLFVVNYSRIEVVKHTLTGVNYRSNVDRAAKTRHMLDKAGEQAIILKLQGYIFFGTANNVLSRVRSRAYAEKQLPLRYVVLDFRMVTGLDSSALNSFAKLKMLAETRGFHLVFSHLSAKANHLFRKGDLISAKEKVIALFPDLDHALEWVENSILRSMEAGETHFSNQLTGVHLLADLLGSSVKMPYSEAGRLAGNLMAFTEERRYREGEYLIRQGSAPSGVYIIEAGQVTVQLEDTPQGTMRLRRMYSGTVVGELGVYLGLPATAAVVASKPCTVLFLSADALQKMEKESPQIAAAFHKYIAQSLGERLSNSNNTLRALMD